MEPWQYSALNAKFASLQQQLTRKPPPQSFSQGAINNCERVQGTPFVSMDSSQVRTGIKRKAEDVCPNELSITKNRSVLQLDVYTQTDESLLLSHHLSKNLQSKIRDVMEEGGEVASKPFLYTLLIHLEVPCTFETSAGRQFQMTQKKLEEIEKVLHALGNKVDMILSSSHKENDVKVERMIDANSPSPASSPETPATPCELYPSTANAFSVTPNISSLSQGTNGWSGGMPQSTGNAAQQLLDISVLDVGPNTTFPLIIASEDKCSSTEATVQDLANGNVTLDGIGPVSLIRGCWLGDRADPRSRVWYSGEPKTIMQAESAGGNPVKLALNLMDALFTREEMAASNVSGARGHEVLDPVKIKAIQAHVNFKFPLDSLKEDMRWHLLKPRIDSKCRAQRRQIREQACATESSTAGPMDSGHARKRGRPYKAVINAKVKDELLYGCGKSNAGLIEPESTSPRPRAPSYDETVAVYGETGDTMTQVVDIAAHAHNALGFASNSLQQHQ
ncbi:protein BANP isoform X2 [Nematostella vectensis]|uniref:protein BANP isoform X2 n=1 Tax=Nematostella vectensis TaxID=45351 RepID=UPI0020773F4E|nr:protein BANP isoform X2 [Nematostella vectensis]